MFTLIASVTGQDKIVDVLVKAGAQTNIQDQNGKSALIFCTLIMMLFKLIFEFNHFINSFLIAVLKGEINTVINLLNAGADTDTQDNEGQTALMLGMSVALNFN